MKVIRTKVRNFCSNCDWNEQEYIITNNESFKLFWAYGETDTEIGFCRKCAEDLYEQLENILFR